MIRIEYLVSLAESFANLAQSTWDKYSVKIDTHEEKLPEKSIDDIEILMMRANHVLQYTIDWQLEKIGPILKRNQLDALIRLTKSYQTYREVLTVRLKRLERKQDNAADLSRLSAVAGLNMASLKKSYLDLAEELGKSNRSIIQ